MAEYTRPATWDDLRELARYLADAGVEYALVGGYAIAAHGLNRFSEDIDILVEPGAENARRWVLALGRLPDGAVRELGAEADVFMDGVPLQVLSLEGLLLTKQGVRPKDQMDAAVLRRAIAALSVSGEGEN
ncbi:MAG: nucleotidyl transferase AbiEii/AbiGii toxin family protein [Steroidobacteraceae bacterium]|nr:nucleotidyl transferase AbiEii/AbiGii toxin family protein [Steroidobacteraceae bacterium]MCW5572378.1 nucleotidyl transferase AbiEii/AbiGii toxin family protein [Steroidobacteraceae bacterium]